MIDEGQADDAVPRGQVYLKIADGLPKDILGVRG